MPDSEKISPCLVYIDAEGHLWHENASMTHTGINLLLLENITINDQGHHVIQWRGQQCEVEVEDTAIVVQRVNACKSDGTILELILSDGNIEPLNPDLVWINQDNIVYTKIRQGTLPARFLRQAYYQLADFIEETEPGFAIVLNEHKHLLMLGKPHWKKV